MAPSVEFGSNLQSSLGDHAGDQVDDDVVTDQGLALPVLGDMAEHPMLDLVPFAGPRREVADVDGQAQLARQVLQRDFPEPAAAAVAAAAIGGDQQLAGAGVARRTHLTPPATDRFDGEPGCVVVHADAHPPLFELRSYTP